MNEEQTQNYEKTETSRLTTHDGKRWKTKSVRDSTWEEPTTVTDESDGEANESEKRRSAWTDYAIDLNVYLKTPIKQMARSRNVFGVDNRDFVDDLYFLPIGSDQAVTGGLKPSKQLEKMLARLNEEFTVNMSDYYERTIIEFQAPFTIMCFLSSI